MIQLCRARGAVPVAVSSEGYEAALKETGAEAVLLRGGKSLAMQLDAEVPGRAVDVVADLVWGKLFNELINLLKPEGRYIAVEPNLVNPSILWYHVRRRVEWGLLKQNQFSLPSILRKDFDVSIRYDNTIISFLNERTKLIWKAANAFTSIWPTKYLSFRYMMTCTKKG